MTKRLVITSAVVAVFLAGLAIFNYVVKPAMIQKFVAQNAPPPASVAAEPAKSEKWVTRINSIGSMTAIQGVELSSQVGGVVSAIQFESGETVQKGAHLVKLDDQVEQADLASNKATLREALLEFERQKDLQGRGFAAEAKLEEARTARDSASAAVQRTRAVIAQKTIVAPFSGKLGLKQVEIGQYVSPGQMLVSLQALDPIWVDFPIPEKEIGLLKPGQTLEITVDAYRGETFTGVVETLDARVSKETRTLIVRGRLPNPGGKLLPGMFANVTVLSGEPKEIVSVPRTAITFSLYGDSIYVVKEEGSAAKAGAKTLVVDRRPVRTGATRGDRIAILEGIKAGEMVVTTGQLKLRPGARVTINNEAPLTPAPERPRL
jgi:membrane fusion protein (multidrug efflux system)